MTDGKDLAGVVETVAALPIAGLLGHVLMDALNGRRGDDQKRIARMGISIVELLLRKNADYGSSAWQVPLLAPDQSPDTGIRVRMSDKISRLQQLLSGKKAEVTEEVIEETFRDLAGYCVLWLARPD
ncbi:MAG: nucleotide modification associated domain-containing protein [Planctomycetaceae bacterium]